MEFDGQGDMCSVDADGVDANEVEEEVDRMSPIVSEETQSGSESVSVPMVSVADIPVEKPAVEATPGELNAESQPLSLTAGLDVMWAYYVLYDDYKSPELKASAKAFLRQLNLAVPTTMDGETTYMTFGEFVDLNEKKR